MFVKRESKCSPSPAERETGSNYIHSMMSLEKKTSALPSPVPVMPSRFLFSKSSELLSTTGPLHGCCLPRVLPPSYSPSHHLLKRPSMATLASLPLHSSQPPPSPIQQTLQEPGIPYLSYDLILLPSQAFPQFEATLLICLLSIPLKINSMRAGLYYVLFITAPPAPNIVPGA